MMVISVRNTFRGPSFADIDLSLFKNIKATERFNFQFRAEAFNIANRVNLYLPNMRLGQSSSLFDHVLPGVSVTADPVRVENDVLGHTPIALKRFQGPGYSPGPFACYCRPEQSMSS